jgi:hypothetical protein
MQLLIDVCHSLHSNPNRHHLSVGSQPLGHTPSYTHYTHTIHALHTHYTHTIHTLYTHYTHTHTPTQTHTHTPTHSHAHSHTHSHTHSYTHTHSHTHTHTLTHTHTHTLTHTLSHSGHTPPMLATATPACRTRIMIVMGATSPPSTAKANTAAVQISHGGLR